MQERCPKCGLFKGVKKHICKYRPRLGKIIKCEICGKSVYLHQSRLSIGRFCSQKCKGRSWQISKKNVGKKNPAWKGGQIINYAGYVYILNHGHPRANNAGYVKRSFLVMEKIINRYLTKEEIVHHKGIKYNISSAKNKQDDRPKNLKLFANKSAHTKFHHIIKRKQKLVT